MTVVKGPEGMQRIAGLAKKKGNSPVSKLLLLAFLAGGYIAVGTLLACTVGGGMQGTAATDPGVQRYVYASFGVPFALTMILVGGGNLLTGDLMIMPVGVLSGTATPRQLLKVWSCSFCGNFMGALVFTWLISSVSDLPVAGSPQATFVIEAATYRVNELDWGKLIVRGIGCNWMVAMAVWMVVLSDSLTEKFLAAWMCIGTMVAVGFEHSVLNMSLLPMGWMFGANFSFGEYLFRNLLPVTFGNVLGGQLVGLPYWYLYGGASKAPQQQYAQPDMQGTYYPPNAVSKKDTEMGVMASPSGRLTGPS